MDKEKMQEQTEETVENTEVKEENTAEETVETVETPCLRAARSRDGGARYGHGT